MTENKKDIKIPLYKVHLPTDMQSCFQSVFQSGNLSGGPNVQRFESLLQSYIGNRNITTTGDVSSSIALSLFMAGVRPGDEVVASPMACLATNEPIKNLFADVRWCDVDPLTGNMDPDDLARKINPRTRAILVFHWAGNPADLDSIYEIAKSNNIPVVEDAGEALGAEYKGRKIGNSGSDFTVFSFYPNRHITTIDGAAIAFSRTENYERGQWLKRYGIHQPSFRTDDGEINPESDIIEPGLNTYMNHIAASIGVKQMEHLAGIVERHQSNGAFYNDALGSVSGLSVLRTIPDTKSAYWVYTLLAEKRDDLLKYMRSKGVYASKVHLRNDIYSCFGADIENLPGVDYFASRCISIPSGWWVGAEEREFVVDCFNNGW
jgi:dTDP-4-amino-4,6-dideoxygalactose transaminase